MAATNELETSVMDALVNNEPGLPWAETTTQSVAHPLQESFDSLRTRNAQFKMLVDEPEGEGWIEMGWLLDPARPELLHLVDQLSAHHKIKGRSASGVHFFGDYTYVAIAMNAACFMAFQRVPLLDLADISARFNEESHIENVVVRSYRFAALPSDPAAGHPDCVVVETLDGLRDLMREHLIAHVEPFLNAVAKATRAGKPAMWATAGDYVAHAFGWIGKGLGSEIMGVQEATLLTTPPSKIQRNRGYVHVEHCGQEYYMVDRLSCCLWYKSPEGSYCSTCPLRPMEERVDLIKDWLATLAVPTDAQTA
jgi:hypothetical protein